MDAVFLLPMLECDIGLKTSFHAVSHLEYAELNFFKGNVKQMNILMDLEGLGFMRLPPMHILSAIGAVLNRDYAGVASSLGPSMPGYSCFTFILDHVLEVVFLSSKARCRNFVYLNPCQILIRDWFGHWDQVEEAGLFW